MRLSTDPSDRAYHALANSGHVRVWLAGAERTNIVTADEEGRCAITYRLDANGRYVLNKERTEIARDHFHGDVRIDCPQWLRDHLEGEERARRVKEGQAASGVSRP